MTDINLLPENLRDREERELKKLANRQRVFTTEMAFPQKEKKDRSWWRKSFDVSSRPPKPAVSSPETVQEPSSRIDFLSAARKQKMRYLKSNGAKPQKLRLAEVFGSPRSLFQPSSRENQIRPGETKIREKRKSFWPELFKPKPGKLKLVVQAPPNLKSLKAQAIRPAETGPGRNLQAEIKRAEERKQVSRPAEIREQPIEKKGFWSWFFQPVARKPKLRIRLEERRQPKIGLPETKPARVSLPPSPRPKEKPAKPDRKFHLALKAEKSFDINLMPKELVLISYYQPGIMAAIFLLAVILPAVLVSGAWWGIGRWQEKTNGEIAAAQGQVNALKQDLAAWQQKQKKSFELQRKLLAIKDLFSGKARWTGFFDLLEKYTLDGVYYTDFAADVSGEFTLPAVADDYDTVAKQIVALREAKDFVKEAKVENIRLFSTEKAGISGVSFDLKLYLADSVFTRK